MGEFRSRKERMKEGRKQHEWMNEFGGWGGKQAYDRKRAEKGGRKDGKLERWMEMEASST